MGRLRDQMFRTRPAELEDVRALDLLTDTHGELAGVLCLSIRHGPFVVVQARVVVVATGGAATMYAVAAPAREKDRGRAGEPVIDTSPVQFTRMRPDGTPAASRAEAGPAAGQPQVPGLPRPDGAPTRERG